MDDARRVIAAAVSHGVDEALLRPERRTPVQATPRAASDGSVDGEEGVSATAVEQAVAAAMQSLGGGGGGGTGNASARGAVDARRGSTISHVSVAASAISVAAPPPPPPGVSLGGVPPGAGRSGRRRSSIASTAIAGGNGESTGATSSLIPIDTANALLAQAQSRYEDEVYALRNAHEEQVASLHAAYEDALEATATAASSNTEELAAYSKLSARFVELDRERGALFVAEATARRELTALQEAVAKERTERDAREAALTAAANGLQAEARELRARVHALESEMASALAGHDDRLTTLGRDHQRALQLMRREHEQTLESVVAEHRRAVAAANDARTAEIAALQRVYDEKVRGLPWVGGGMACHARLHHVATPPLRPRAVGNCHRRERPRHLHAAHVQRVGTGDCDRCHGGTGRRSRAVGCCCRGVHGNPVTAPQRRPHFHRWCRVHLAPGWRHTRQRTWSQPATVTRAWSLHASLVCTSHPVEAIRIGDSVHA